MKPNTVCGGPGMDPRLASRQTVEHLTQLEEALLLAAGP